MAYAIEGRSIYHRKYKQCSVCYSMLHKQNKRNKHVYPLKAVQSQNNPMDGLALHRVKSVAACPQQVALFLAQPEHLEKSPEKTESASEAKIHQAIDGRHLKLCEITYLYIKAGWSCAELNRQCSLYLYGMHVDTFMFLLADLIKIVQTVFWSCYLIIILYIEFFNTC